MSKGPGRGLDLLLGFWDALHISGTVRARNYKFVTQIDHEVYQQKNAKLGHRGGEGVT